MKIGQLNARSFFALLLLIGCSQSLFAQITRNQLLKYLKTPLAPIPAGWKSLSFVEALKMTKTLVLEGSLEKPEALIQLMTRKALQRPIQEQQVYLEQLFNPMLKNNASLNYSIWKACSKFPRTAFSVQTQQHLREFLPTQPQHLDKWLLLAGFATDDPIPILRVLEEQKSSSTQQAGKLALVRMGDEAKTKSFLKTIKRIPIKDDFVYDIAPLAIYTRDKKVFQYLIDIVLEDRGTCRPADAETDGRISCGYRLVEALLPVLQGVPKEIAQEMTNAKQLSEAKQWLRKNRKRLVVDRQYL